MTERLNRAEEATAVRALGIIEKAADAPLLLRSRDPGWGGASRV